MFIQFDVVSTEERHHISLSYSEGLQGPGQT